MTDAPLTLADLSPEAREAALAALGADDRQIVEAILSNPVTAATAAIEERVRTAQPAPVEAPADTRTNAERLADDVASFMKQRKFTPRPPAPELTSPEIERFKQLVVVAETRVADAQRRAVELEEKGAELELAELLGEKGAAARNALNTKDQVAASLVIEKARRGLAAAKHKLAEAIDHAERERRQGRFRELLAVWDQIVTAAEELQGGFAMINKGAERYMQLTRRINEYRDLLPLMPSTATLQSPTNMAKHVAHAGDDVRGLLGFMSVPRERRQSLVDRVKHNAEQVRAAYKRERE
jgi:hypothetical protein